MNSTIYDQGLYTILDLGQIVVNFYVFHSWLTYDQAVNQCLLFSTGWVTILSIYDQLAKSQLTYLKYM